jgi:hypothetical protein
MPLLSWLQGERGTPVVEGHLKARFPIALADAFAVQVAREKDVPLVTGDPEIRAVERAGEVRVEWIPR